MNIFEYPHYYSYSTKFQRKWKITIMHLLLYRFWSAMTNKNFIWIAWAKHFEINFLFPLCIIIQNATYAKIVLFTFLCPIQVCKCWMKLPTQIKVLHTILILSSIKIKLYKECTWIDKPFTRNWIHIFPS